MDENNFIQHINEVNEIEISDEIVFERVSENSNLNKDEYREVYVSDFSFISGSLLSNGLALSDHTVRLSQIVKQAPNGLFSVNINSEQLSRFLDGKITTMVRDDKGKLIRHEGFYKINLQPAVSPMMIVSIGMQVMSAISGTYYLHKINSHLTNINKKVEKILSIYDDINMAHHHNSWLLF